MRYWIASVVELYLIVHLHRVRLNLWEFAVLTRAEDQDIGGDAGMYSWLISLLSANAIRRILWLK